MKPSRTRIHEGRRAAALAAMWTMAMLAGCGADKATPPDVLPVRTVLVAAGSGQQTTGYTAEIRSRHEADLSFQVGGKLVSRDVDAGTNVHRGTVLARLDPTDQQLGVAAARAAVNSAVAELDRARTEEARYRDLLERGLTTRAAYLNQQTAVRTSQSRLEQATADLRLNEQKLGYTVLRADADGVVTRVMTEAGSVVSPGQRVLSVARPSELEAAFDVPDSDIEAIRHAHGARLYLLNDGAAVADVRVREISPTADSVTRTYAVRASIPDPPPSLLLGMSAVVRFPRTGNQAAVELPATALFQKGQKPAVWVVTNELRVDLRPVDIERYESNLVYVRSGIQAGERVVTAGVHRLSPGDPVRLLAGAGQ